MLGSESMGEGDSASRGDVPGPPEALGAQSSAGVWVPPGPPPRGHVPGEDKPSGADAQDRSQLHRREAGPAPRPWCLSRGRPMLGACVTGPPMPIRAPPELVSTGHSPRTSISGPTATGRSLGTLTPIRSTHVAQLSPKTRGRPRAGGPPPQGQPHPQLHSHRGGHCPARGLVGPRRPACGHSSWVTRGHTKPLLPEVQGGSAQGGREVSGSGHQGPALPVLGGCQCGVLEEAETGSGYGL